MNDINAIINTLSSEDQQRFVVYLEKKNKRSDVKNITLFHLLRKNELRSNEICDKLYGAQGKDAYHALRKRLYQSLIDFTAKESLQEEGSVDMQIIKYILASKSFLQKKQYKVAYRILNKAEKLAIDHDLFPFLNEIYHNKIQYAYTDTTLNIDDLILKFRNNQKNILREGELNIAYAKIRETLTFIAYKGDVLDFQTILNNTFKALRIDIGESLSFKSLYQLIAISSITAFITKDYLRIEPFLINTYQSIIAHKKIGKQQYYHIQVLYAIANALFRNKKFTESLQYLELMHTHMNLSKKKYYNIFKLKYSLLKSLNYNYSCYQKEAIEILEPLIVKKHQDIEALLDIHLSLVVFYFQKNNLDKAYSLLSKFYHTNQWYAEKAGKEWVVKKNLIEILLHIELQNTNLVESKLLSFKRSHTLYLNSVNQTRVLVYLSLVEVYYKNPERVTTKKFIDQVRQSFNWLEVHKEDIFVISFYSWLKAKIYNEDLFKVTMQLISKAQEDAKSS